MTARAIKLIRNGDKVTVSVGLRAEKSPAYTMMPAGELILCDNEYETFRDALARGVKRPTVLIVEEEG